MQTQGQRNSEDPETSDGVLVQQALNGDQEAFEVLVSRYKKSLFGLIYHYVGEYHEVEDILQQVWLQLYLSLATLRPHVQIKPWLFTVARNRSLDFLRHKRLHSQHLLSFSDVKPGNEEDESTFLDAIPDTSRTPEELVEQHDLQREIRYAIQSLPDTYRSVVWLFYGGQLNYAEIGRILNVPGTTVKTHFNRAKPFLRAVFIAREYVVFISRPPHVVLTRRRGKSMNQSAMNQVVQQDFSEIVDQFITRYCQLGAGLSITDKLLFPVFLAFWTATAPETQHPALLGQFRVELAQRGFRSNGPKRPRWYGLSLHQLTVLSEQTDT